MWPSTKPRSRSRPATKALLVPARDKASAFNSMINWRRGFLLLNSNIPRRAWASDPSTSSLTTSTDGQPIALKNVSKVDTWTSIVDSWSELEVRYPSAPPTESCMNRLVVSESLSANCKARRFRQRLTSMFSLRYWKLSGSGSNAYTRPVAPTRLDEIRL